MIFGSAEPLESYCAHLLLSEDEIYFTVIESKGSFSVYGPRPAVQVCDVNFGVTNVSLENGSQGNLYMEYGLGFAMRICCSISADLCEEDSVNIMPSILRLLIWILLQIFSFSKNFQGFL